MMSLSICLLLFSAVLQSRVKSEEPQLYGCILARKNKQEDILPSNNTITYDCLSNDTDAKVKQCITTGVTNMANYLTINHRGKGSYCIDFWGRMFPADSGDLCVHVVVVRDELHCDNYSLSTHISTNTQMFTPLFWKSVPQYFPTEYDDKYATSVYADIIGNCTEALKDNNFSMITGIDSYVTSNIRRIQVTIKYCCKAPGCFKAPTTKDEAIRIPQCSKGHLSPSPDGEFFSGRVISQFPIEHDNICYYSESFIKTNESYYGFDNKCGYLPKGKVCTLGFEHKMDDAPPERFICCSMSMEEDPTVSMPRLSNNTYTPLAEAVLSSKILRDKFESEMKKCAGLIDVKEKICFFYYNLVETTFSNLNIISETRSKVQIYKENGANCQLVYANQNTLVPYIYCECKYSTNNSCDSQFYTQSFIDSVVNKTANLNHCIQDGNGLIENPVFACAFKLSMPHRKVIRNQYVFQVNDINELTKHKDKECIWDGINSITCLCRPDYDNESNHCNDEKNFLTAYDSLYDNILTPVDELRLFTRDLKVCGANLTELEGNFKKAVSHKSNFMCYKNLTNGLSEYDAIYFDKQVNKIDSFSRILCEQAFDKDETTLSGCNCAFIEAPRQMKGCCCKPPSIEYV